MKKQLLIIIILAVIAMGGAFLTAWIDMGGRKMSIAEGYEIFQKLMRENSSFDGHSVSWDGKSASLIEDELDTEEMSGSRYAYWDTNLYVSGDKMWSFYYIDLKNKSNIKAEDDAFTLSSDKEYIKVQKAGFEEAKEILEKSGSMFPVNDEKFESIAQRSGFNSFVCACGLKNVNDKTYAGYTASFVSKYGDSYKVEYFGMGNMENLKTCFEEILSSFNG